MPGTGEQAYFYISTHDLKKVDKKKEQPSLSVAFFKTTNEKDVLRMDEEEGTDDSNGKADDKSGTKLKKQLNPKFKNFKKDVAVKWKFAEGKTEGQISSKLARWAPGPAKSFFTDERCEVIDDYIKGLNDRANFSYNQHEQTKASIIDLLKKRMIKKKKNAEEAEKAKEKGKASPVIDKNLCTTAGVKVRLGVQTI